MPDQKPALPLNTQYATQVAGDLERIATRMGELEAELAALQADRALLERVRATIEDVPVPRQALDDTLASPAPSAQGEKKRAGKGSEAAVADPAPVPGRARASRPARPARPASGPTLVELVLQHMSAQTEPRSAAEVYTTLAEAHPQRHLSIPLVRNAIEARVAQGEIVRTKQGRSVFYSAVRAVGADSEATSGEAST